MRLWWWCVAGVVVVAFAMRVQHGVVWRACRMYACSMCLAWGLYARPSRHG